MKKVIILLVTVMATLQLHAQDPNFWIFLCFGQSNMAGQAPIEAQDLAVNDRYLSLATTDGNDRQLGTWRKAIPPLCRADAHLGPADWFGRTLLDVVPENVRVGIVSVAVEGCPITFFDKDQNKPLIAKEERDWMNGILNQYGRAEENLPRPATGATFRLNGCSLAGGRGGQERIWRRLRSCQSHHQRHCQPLSEHVCRLFRRLHAQ